MAYAKYLSPEFHMWCNTVVRERMHGRPPVVVDHGKIGRQVAAIVDDRIENALGKIPLLIDQAVEARIAADPRRAVLDYVDVRQLLDDAKALQKGRRRLNAKVGRELRNAAALSPGSVASKCAHSGVWLFKRGFAALFMRERGAALVREHNDATIGQKNLWVIPGGKAEKDSPVPAGGGCAAQGVQICRHSMTTGQ